MNISTFRWAPQRSCTSHSRISLKATVKRSVPEAEKWHVCSESLCCVKSWHLPLLQLISFSTRSRRTGRKSIRISGASSRQTAQRSQTDSQFTHIFSRFLRRGPGYVNDMLLHRWHEYPYSIFNNDLWGSIWHDWGVKLMPKDKLIS